MRESLAEKRRLNRMFLKSSETGATDGVVKEPKKTYVGAAVFFERLPDDGWPEDVGQ
jgi:hypothetical protein